MEELHTSNEWVLMAESRNTKKNQLIMDYE